MRHLAGYRRRVLDAELDDLATGVAAIALEGAKAVGKTATAAERAATIFELDLPGVAELAGADPGRLLEAHAPVLLDEWQRLPALWDLVRRAVDDGVAPGTFYLTGSVSAENPGTHTGAGRIVRVRVRPLSLAERGLTAPTVSLADLMQGERPPIFGATTVGLTEYVEEIVGSGFPAIRVMAPRLRRAQLDGYLERVIDRDFPEAGHKLRNPAALRRWMAAYAAATSTTATYDSIRAAATPGESDKPGKVATQAYRDTLERLWILDPLPGWIPSRDHLKELGTAPKHHLADPALAVHLLGLDPGALLRADGPSRATPHDGTFLGALFESLVCLSVRVYAQGAEGRVSHLRLHRGDREIDLIVERRDQKVVAIETKLSATVSDDDVKHLLWLRERLGADLLDAVVVTTGTNAYRRADGIAVVPAALLGP